MENRAQVYNPYKIDMFTALETGERVTFTDEGAPAGYYKVIPDATGHPFIISISLEFHAHFKFYQQATIF